MHSALRLLAAALLASVFSAGWSRAAAESEDHDFGIAPSAVLRLADYAAPTPREIPGAKTIRTAELRERLVQEDSARPLLLDVIGDAGHDSVPGAIWLPGAGRGASFDDALQAHLAKALDLVTRGDKRRAMVFFCAGVKCWLSYNAALRAASLGYTEVHWYRGGIEAWLAAGGRLAPLRVAWRRPESE